MWRTLCLLLSRLSGRRESAGLSLTKYLEKLMKGKPIRTIVGEYLPHYVGGKALHHGPDKALKENWAVSHSMVGASMTQQGFDVKMKRMRASRMKMSCDYSQFDSSFWNQWGTYLAHLYTPGFRLTADDERTLWNQIKARAARVRCGFMSDIAGDEVAVHGHGGTTGAHSVTRPNIEISKAMIVVTVAKLLDID